jgi:chromosome segregation ATPase
MYKWVDENGKVSFSDQIPPSKVELGHQELDKNAQVIKAAEKAKTKAEIEIEKRLALLRKQQEQVIIQQKALDKKLLSSFLTVNAMDIQYKAKVQAINGQEQEMLGSVKKLEEELTAKQQEAADYEIKNKKIPPKTLDKIEENQKKIAQTKLEIQQLKLKKQSVEKDFVKDRARYVFLSQSTSKNTTTTAAPVTTEKIANQPGVFNCSDAAQCEKAWPIAKEFVKTNSVAKISVESDRLFLSEDPVSDTELNLSISKITAEDKTIDIFLDIRCTQAATAKGLCASSKADEMRTRFTDYLKSKLNIPKK